MIRIRFNDWIVEGQVVAIIDAIDEAGRYRDTGGRLQIPKREWPAVRLSFEDKGIEVSGPHFN